MRRGGFSLVEISIVLVVISVMISGVLPYITESQKTNAANDTAERLEAIELAMLTFRAANGFIPCPSDITTALNGGTFGAAVASGCATATFTDANNAAGGVPTRDLGLSDEYAFDGWGRRMTYHVTRALTGAGYSTGTGALTVNDASGAARTTAAAYAVVSHGPGGHGAYTRAGTRFSFGTTNANEQENCDCNTSAATTGTVPFAYDSILVQSMALPNSDPLAAFDDIVRYQIKPSLELLVGGGGGTGSCTGVAPSGWPDAIKCSVTNPNWGQRVLYIQNAPYTPDGRYYYMEPADNGGTTRYVSFNADKSFAAAVGYTTHTCNQSISTLEAAGQTFNFCGGSGGAGWEDVPLMDTANFDINCQYRFSSGGGGAMNNPTYVTSTALYETSFTAPGSGVIAEYRVLASNKAQFNWKTDGNTTYSGGPAAVTKLEKNCGGGGGSGGAVVGFSANTVTSGVATLSGTVIRNYETVTVNEGGGFNNTTGQFTAPEAGLYFFSTQARHTANGSLHLTKNGTSFGNAVKATVDADLFSVTATGATNLAAGDVVSAAVSTGALLADSRAGFSGFKVGGGGGGGGISDTDFQTVSNSVTAIGNKTVSVDCPVNYTMTGGGCRTVAWGSEIVHSQPTTNGWACSAKDIYGTAQTTTVYARCVLTN